ncbi:hypothetical protein Pcinc_044311 [Petrolisthes cinctipes]|uniref:Serine racemase n=1 Tax=Petrolisthes cinctipes TaxID=88211 RepID=A0AAE1BEF2_PETCI|nr:hypothetical protein Pcinc_044311 [Petrolisthes cinctipes]
MTAPFGLNEIKEALTRIRGWIHRTPIITSHQLDTLAGRKLFFKTENLQKTGSFKVRGACNAVFLEKEKNPDGPGVVTHSSGNHGQAVAYAAKCAGLACSVVVPEGTPKVKCDAIQHYGAELVFCQPSPAARKETCERIAEETGRAVIHPYDNYNVMAGQGTIALELLEEVPNLDAILVPISGGGMTSGIAVAAHHMQPSCRVYAVEPFGKMLEQSLKSKQRLWPNPPQFLNTIADAIRTQQFVFSVFAVEPEGKELQRCLVSRKRLWSNPPKFLDTVADSIRIQQVGELTFPVLCQFAETQVFSITDDQMVEGMRLAMERTKMVVEAASGAAVYAGVRCLEDVEPKVERVGVILCGGNVDLDQLPWIHPSTSY